MGKKLLELYLHFINPLKPKIDKQQFKPNNIKSNIGTLNVHELFWMLQCNYNTSV